MHTAVKGLIGAYAVYLAGSLPILLPALNSLPHRLLQEHYGRQLTSELIVFNPFTLALQVRKATLSEPDGAPFLAFSYAEVNLSVTSVWQPGLVFDAIAVNELSLHLQRQADGQLNIADFMPAPAADPPPAPTPLPGITIAELRLDASRIELTDYQHPESYNTYLEAFSLTVHDLSTVAQEGQPYRLEARGEGGGLLRWEGDLSIAAGHSEGQLQLDNIDLQPAWRFARPWVGFQLERSHLNLGLHYTLDWSDALHYAVRDGSLSIRDSVLSPQPQTPLPDTGVSLASISLEGITLDSTQQSVSLDSLTLQGLAVEGWSEGDRVSLAELLLPANSRDPQEKPTETTAATDETGWTLQLKLAQLQQGALRWRSEFTDPALMQVTPINAELHDLRWPAVAPSAFSASLRLNDAAQLDLAGALHAGDGRGDIAFALESLPLAWFAPNLPAILQAQVSSGEARTRGTVELDNFLPQEIVADGAIIDFAMQLQGADDALTRWDSVSWTSLKVLPPAHSVTLTELHIEGYEGRLHVLEDGTLNTQRLLADNTAEDTAENKPEQEAAADTATSAEAAWGIDVPTIFVSDSTLDFLDESLPIRFSAVIGDLDGTITGLSSRPGQALEVDLKGSVDGYAPVTLAGTASPLQTPPALDLTLRFKGLDMARLTPYSGTYAGYAINNGIMTVDLRYSLENNRLQGNNKIVINQLQLGERVESSKAMDLPLRLGIALLTDSNGVIEIAVPVSGDVNNPQFSLGSVIAGAFVNLLSKAVTAPFALLANLIGSSEDLDTVDFAAGGSELDEHSQNKLRDLAAAMQQRPKLALQITGRLDPDSDRTQLQRQLSSAALLAAGLSEDDVRDRTRAWEDVVTAFYAALDTTPTADSDAEPPSVLQQARIIRDQWPVPAAALVELATRRAATTQAFLLTAGIDAARVALAPASAEAAENTFSGVELAITL